MNEPETEIVLLAKIKTGDERAFVRLFEIYFTSLCRYIFLHINQKGIAEEIALDILMAIWEKRETFQIEVALKAYLFHAAKNRILNYFRDNERFVLLDDFSKLERFEDDYAIEVNELQHLITEAICSLPDNCKEVFIKSREENLSNKEIATQLNISIKTVESQVTKAVKYIKEYLKNSYYYFF